MVEEFLAAVVSIVAGALLGAANSVFGWIKNNEPFETRKFAITVVTGIIAGVVLVVGNISGLLSATTNTDFLLQLVGLALMIFGANFARGVVTEAISSRMQPTAEPTPQ